MKFVCYLKCTTCQKAKKFLTEHSVPFEERHIKEERFSYEEMAEIYRKSGLELKKFFNTSGNSYKALGLKEKLPSMSTEEALHLLASDGMLVKRPILITEDRVLVGFKEEEWRNALPAVSKRDKL